MRTLTVVGLSADGHALVLRLGTEVFEVPRDEVARAEQALPFVEEPVPSPREIQQRIRQGESSAQIARLCGLPPEHVERYEGPPLAERAHHVRGAQAARVEGRPVLELVDEHAERAGLDPADTVWDAILVEPGRWRVTARSEHFGLSLRWEPGPRRLTALDEPARQALRLAPLEQDALGAVLRPVSGRRAAAAQQQADRLDAAVLGRLASVQPSPPSAPEAARSSAPSSPPGRPRPAAQVPAAQVPAAQVPAAQVPAAQVPAAQVPAAQVPAAALPDPAPVGTARQVVPGLVHLPEAPDQAELPAPGLSNPTAETSDRAGVATDESVVPAADAPAAADGVAAVSPVITDTDASADTGTGADTDPDSGQPLPDEAQAPPAQSPSRPRPAPARPRRARVSLPSWDVISTEVTGRGPDDHR